MGHVGYKYKCDAGKQGFRIGGMQGVGCRTGEMQDRRDAGKVERKNAGKEARRKV